MVNVSTVVIRIWSVFLGLLFLAVLVLGVISIFLVSSLRGVGVGITLFGFLGIFVSIAGCIGAGFDKERKLKGQRKELLCLFLFFGILVVLHILFAVFGVTLICLQPSIEMIASLPSPSFRKIYDALPKWSDDVYGTIGKLKKYVFVVGIFLIVFAVLIFFTSLVGAYRMGAKLFTKSFMATFSIIEVVIGFSLGGFLLFLNFSAEYQIFGHEVCA